MDYFHKNRLKNANLQVEYNIFIKPLLHKTFESTFSESHTESDHLLNLQHKINSATAAAHQIHAGQRPLSFSVENILAPGRFGNHQFSVSHLSTFDVDGKIFS